MKYFSRLKRGMLYLGLPLILASCHPSVDSRPSFLERAADKLSRFEPPNLDNYPAKYEQSWRTVRRKEFRDLDNIDGISAYQDVQDRERTEDDPVYKDGKDFSLKICEEAFKGSAEDFIKDYLEGSELASSLKKISESRSHDGNVRRGFKPGFSHGDFTVKGFIKIEDLKFFSMPVGGEFKVEFGSEGGKIKYERGIEGGLSFFVDYYRKQDFLDFIEERDKDQPERLEEAVRLGIVRSEIGSDRISEFRAFVGFGSSNLWEDEDQEGCFFGYLQYPVMFK